MLSAAAIIVFGVMGALLDLVRVRTIAPAAHVVAQVVVVIRPVSRQR